MPAKVVNGFEGDEADGAAALGDAIAELWPEGAPAEEAGFLRTLPPSRRGKIARRLWAVLRAEAPGADLGAIATAAGISRTAFFELRRRWARARSLRSLAPYEPRDRGGSPSAPHAAADAGAPPPLMPSAVAAGNAEYSATAARADPPAGRRHATERAAAVAALRADPAAANGELARRVAREVGSALDHRTLVRLVRRERRLLHFTPASLLGVYGRALLADVSALDLALDLDGRREVAILALVVERSSTLVLGHAVGARADAIALQGLAAERAMSFLARERADVPAGVRVGMRVVLGPGGGRDAERLAAIVVEMLGPSSLSADGRLRYGVRAAELIGQPGRVAMRPRSTEPMAGDADDASRSGGEALRPLEADALLGVEMARHNRSVLDALRKVGLVGGGEARGAMAALLADVFLDARGW